MAALSAPARLTYIGLWCLADDAGYLIWQPEEIAAELYRFQSPSSRRRTVASHLEKLVESARVKVLECARHAVIPTLEAHRIKGGQTLHTIRKRHEKECSTHLLRRDMETSVSVSVSDSVSGQGQVYESGRRRAKEKTVFDKSMAAAGLRRELRPVG
jgi:hypothetical protein